MTGFHLQHQDGTTMSLAAAWEQQELPSGPGCAFTPAKPILGPDRVTLQVGIGSRLRSQYHVQYLYGSVLMLQTKTNVVKFNKDWFLAVQKSIKIPIATYLIYWILLICLDTAEPLLNAGEGPPTLQSTVIPAWNYVPQRLHKQASHHLRRMNQARQNNINTS